MLDLFGYRECWQQCFKLHCIWLSSLIIKGFSIASWLPLFVLRKVSTATGVDLCEECCIIV